MKPENMAHRKLALRLLTEKRHMADVLDAVCDNAAVQCIILDKDARLLAHSQKQLYPNQMWTQIRHEGGIPYHFLLEHTPILEELWRLAKTRRPVCSKIRFDRDLQLVSVPMLPDHIFAGYVIVCAGCAYETDLLEDLAHLLGRLYLHKNTPSDRLASIPDGFFMSAIAWELLASDTEIVSDLIQRSPEQLGSIIDGMRIPAIRPPFIVAALSANNRDSDALYQLGRRLRKGVPDMYYLAMEGKLLAIFVNVKQAQTLYDALRTFIADYDLQCGLSLPFACIEERRFYKAQALHTLQLGQRRDAKESLFQADWLYPELLLKAVADKFGTRMLWRTDLQVLVTHDQQNGTAYLKTLGQYLRSGGSLTKTAGQLFIDRSTLNYRLEKIQSMMNCDIEDPACASRLLIAISIHDLAVQSTRI